MSLKILHFFPWTSWGSLGGTEKYILEISKYQSVQNKVFIAYPIRHQKRIKTIDKTPVNEIILSDTNPNNNSLIGMGFWASSSIKEWRKLLKIEKFDIIHFHCYEQYLLPYFIAARFYKAKVVFTPHIANFTCTNGNLINAQSNQICDGKVFISRCTKCLLVSNRRIPLLKYIKQGITIFIKKSNFKILNLFINKIITINNNYYDILLNNDFSKTKISVIKPIVQRNIANNNVENSPEMTTNLKVIYIGRLSTLKGLDVLINSFENLKHIQISLHIYGPPGDIDIKKITSEHIHYHGVFAFEEINSILNKYDVLCLPSTSYEMMPLVIQEAIANGLYIIGSDVPGITELVTQGINGVIVERNNSKSLTKAFIDLQYNYKKNHNFIMESFESISNRLLKEYNTIRIKPLNL